MEGPIFHFHDDGRKGKCALVYEIYIDLGVLYSRIKNSPVQKEIIRGENKNIGNFVFKQKCDGYG